MRVRLPTPEETKAAVTLNAKGGAPIFIPEDGAYETVGGYLMSVLGKIPAVGDQIDIDGGVLRVERMDGRRVDRESRERHGLVLGVGGGAGLQQGVADEGGLGLVRLGQA